jgi:uncharacterized protein (TIGR02246 family)
MKTLLTMLVAAGLAGATLAAPLTEKEQAAIKQELNQTVQNLLGAFERADIEKILGFFADDTAFLSIDPEGKVSDSPTFRKATREFFQTVSGEKIRTKSQDIRILDAGTAIMAWQGGYQTMMKDGTIVKSEAYAATFVFKRIGRDWKIIYDHESGLPPAPVLPVAADTSTEVLGMMDEYFAAVNALDPARFLEFFVNTEDLTVFEDKDRCLSRKEFAAFVDSFFKGVTLIQATWEQRTVHELAPNVAVATGTFKVEAKDTKGAPMAVHNAFTFVLVKQGGHWLVKHVHESSLGLPAPDPVKP